MRVELTNRLSLPQRRQEEEYYTRLEAERRRQHEEAERKLLTPDDPAGLYRPPLPRDYQPPAPHNPTNTPPPPPQRNTSYLKTQVTSPDTLYTAKFVSYAGDEDEDEDAGSGGGSQSGQVKLSATRKSYGDLPASAYSNHKPQPPPTARKPRPVSDGIFLSGSFQPPFNNSNSTGPPLPAKPSSIPPGGYKGRPRERGERSQARHSALHSSRTSLSLTHSSFLPSQFSLSLFLLVFQQRGLLPFSFSTVYFFLLLHVCPNFFVVNQSLRSSLCFYMWKFSSLSSKRIRLYLFCIFIYVGLLKHLLLSPVIFLLLVLLQSPLSPPPHTHKPSISTSETEKAIDNHTTTFCCRLRPIRANHSTVGVVARRLFCVWFVAAWDRGAWPAVSLPARPLPAPWLCLAVLALKGRRHTIGFTHLINRPIKNQSALISSTRKNAHRSSVLSERPRLSVCGCFKSFSWNKHFKLLLLGRSQQQSSITAAYIQDIKGHIWAIAPS